MDDPNIEDIFRYLIPFVFIILWIFGNIAAAKKKARSQQSPPKQQRPPEDIYDVLRREIMGKRGMREGGAVEYDGQGRPIATPNLTVQVKKAYAEVEHEGGIRIPLEQELTQTEAEYRRQQKLLNAASQTRKSRSPTSSRQMLIEKKIQRAPHLGIRNWLNTPAAMKKAFLACEILGAPVSLRSGVGVDRPWGN